MLHGFPVSRIVDDELVRPGSQTDRTIWGDFSTPKGWPTEPKKRHLLVGGTDGVDPQRARPPVRVLQVTGWLNQPRTWCARPHREDMSKACNSMLVIFW